MADGAFSRYAQRAVHGDDAPGSSRKPTLDDSPKLRDRGPVFIVGMPRSGTKLLRGLLTQSPSIRLLDIETDFFPFLVRWVREHGEARSERDFEQLHAAMRTAPYFVHRTDRPEFSIAQWRQWCNRFDAAGLFEGFARYETQVARDQDVLWGDKSPGYIRHIGLLLEHFPDARIVHIVRDVRDHCASIRKAWHKDVRRAAYLWGRDVGIAHRQCLAHPRQCLELRYEDLLQSPESQMRRLCQFLDIGFATEMTRLHHPVEHRGDARGTEIVQSNFGKFVERLSTREIRAIEALAFDTMHTLGLRPLYARRRRRMSNAELKVRRVKDGIGLILRGKGTLGIVGALRFHLTHGRLAH